MTRTSGPSSMKYQVEIGTDLSMAIWRCTNVLNNHVFWVWHQIVLEHHRGDKQDVSRCAFEVVVREGGRKKESLHQPKDTYRNHDKLLIAVFLLIFERGTPAYEGGMLTTTPRRYLCNCK